MNSKKALGIIKEITGEEAYKKILEELSGATVYFPTSNNGLWTDKDDRNLSLREDFYSGQYEISDLARKYNLSISRVYKIIQQRE